MRSLEDVMGKNCQELQNLLPLVTCLAGSKEAKEQLWIGVFRFMDQVMPADTADCSLSLLAEDAFNAIAYADQVCCSVMFQLDRQRLKQNVKQHCSPLSGHDDDNDDDDSRPHQDPSGNA